MLLTGSGTLESIAQLFTVIIIFVFVLALTYYTTRYIANFQKQKLDTTNMEVLETTKIAPTKYLQIVRAGDKHILIAVCKDSVTLLCELDADSIQKKSDAQSMQSLDFKSILEKAAGRMKNGPTEKKQAKKDE